MKKSRKRHTSAFKKQVAIELIRGEKTRSEICSQYAIHSSLGDKWKTQLLQNADAAFSQGYQDRHKADKQLIEELYKKIGILEVEADWLKKKLGIECS